MRMIMIALTLIAIASPAMAETLTKVEQKVFLKSCIGDDSSMSSYCECTLNELQQNMTADEIRQLGAQGENSAMNNDKFADAVVTCSKKMPESLTQVEQKLFLKSCIGNDTSMTAYCECTLTELQKRMSSTEIRQLGAKGTNATLNNDKVADAVVACSDKVPVHE